MSDDPQAEIERLRAEDARLKRSGHGKLAMKVSEKGALSVYGMGRFPLIQQRKKTTMRVVQYMLALAVAAILGTATTSARAPARRQALPLPSKLFASSLDVAALIDKAKHDQKPGQPMVIEPLLSLAPYRANLEYRTAVGSAGVHVHEDEFIYVIDGSGTLITGGKLVHPIQTDAENLTGDSIVGGKAVPVAKGDFFVVPKNTPHWFSSINGRVIDMSLHVPGSKVR